MTPYSNCVLTNPVLFERSRVDSTGDKVRRRLQLYSICMYQVQVLERACTSLKGSFEIAPDHDLSDGIALQL